MKNSYRNNSNKNTYSSLLKYLLIGPLVGALFAFLILYSISGNLPFTRTNAVGLGDVGGLITIYYLFVMAIGAILGLIGGIIFGIMKR